MTVTEIMVYSLPFLLLIAYAIRLYLKEKNGVKIYPVATTEHEGDKSLFSFEHRTTGYDEDYEYSWDHDWDDFYIYYMTSSLSLSHNNPDNYRHDDT